MPVVASTGAVSPFENPGVAARLDFYRQALGMPVGLDFEGCFLSLEGKVHPAEWGLGLYLVLLGRYPRPDELDKLRFQLEAQGKKRSLDSVMSDPGIQKESANAAHVRLKRADPNRLYINVSHTVEVGYNAGIERVVRSISKELHERRPQDVQFFRLDATSHQPRELHAWESVNLLKFSELHQAAVETPSRLLPEAKRWFGLFGSYVYDDFRHLARIGIVRMRTQLLPLKGDSSSWVRAVHSGLDRLGPAYSEGKSAMRRILKGAPALQEVLWFDSASLLYPEIGPYGWQGELHQVIAALPRVKLGAIVYDLIPVLNPEYCIAVEEFVRYLSVLKFVDRVSCISKTVLGDVERYVRFAIPERAGRIDAKAHLLAGDFTGDDGGGASPPPSEVPELLCVGTLEPRKNHLNIIRAAYLVWSKGIRFKLHIVGRHGWKAESIFEAQRTFDPDGEFLFFHRGVTDKKLSELYRSARFTVFCSYVEGFGLPVLESLHFRRPVITSRKGSMMELAESHGGCVLVDPADPAEIAAEIERLLTDSAYYQQKAQEIGALAPAKSWALYAEEILRHFLVTSSP